MLYGIMTNMDFIELVKEMADNDIIDIVNNITYDGIVLLNNDELSRKVIKFTLIPKEVVPEQYSTIALIDKYRWYNANSNPIIEDIEIDEFKALVLEANSSHIFKRYVNSDSLYHKEYLISNNADNRRLLILNDIIDTNTAANVSYIRFRL